MNAEPMIRLLGRKGYKHKIRHLNFAGCRLLCDKRMAYAAVGGRIGAEPAIRPPNRKDQYTKIGTPTLQNARLPCGKRMAYAAA